jgi:hypothetical protein
VDIETVKKAVMLACRAPAVHNSQPWRWVAENDVVHLFIDRRQRVPATDHSGRQAMISCGPVLDHLRIAATAALWQPSLTRFPSAGDPDHLATVDFSAKDHVTTGQRNRAGAIPQRRTDRLPFVRPNFWHLFEPVLLSTVDDTVATLDVLTDEQRPRLADASQLTEALRRDDSSYHTELHWWTSPFALSQGVPPSALVSAAERHRVDVGRHFPVRRHQDRRAEIEADRSTILVLSTPEDTRSDVLRCGEVPSTVLLECTMAGMATCTLTHLIESTQSRDIVRNLIGRRGEPQVLIHVGITPPFEDSPLPTPRRPLDTVLEIR